MKFSEIPQLYRANYKINMPWGFIDKWIISHRGYTEVDLDPDFQRAHVWTETKQREYLEYILAGGPSAREIQWNCYGWDRCLKPGPFLLVDGKQRLTAISKFLNNEIKTYGYYCNEIEDNHRFKMITGPDCLFFVNNLPNKREVLKWYLQLNRGGVIHTEEEINKVEELLRNETL